MRKLDDNWLYKTSVLADLAARRVSDAIQSACDLNLSQWRVLVAVADRPGRTASEVVDVTPMDKGIVSRAVSVLVERDLLERRASAKDGRLSHLHLTAAGRETYRAVAEQLRRSGASGETLLNEAEREALVSLLNKAIDRYKISNTP